MPFKKMLKEGIWIPRKKYLEGETMTKKVEQETDIKDNQGNNKGFFSLQYFTKSFESLDESFKLVDTILGSWSTFGTLLVDE